MYFLGKFNRQTDIPTNQPAKLTDQPTETGAQREATLSVSCLKKKDVCIT